MEASWPSSSFRPSRLTLLFGISRWASILILLSFSLIACAHKKPVTAPDLAPVRATLSCESSQVCFAQVMQAQQRGDSAQAIDLAKKMLDRFRQDRWTARAVFLLGKWESEQGNPEAQAHLERAMIDLPELQDYALFYLGQAAMLRGDLVEAMTRFDALRTRVPGSIWVPQAWYHSGEAAFMAGLYPQARQRLEAFRAVSPNDRLAPSALLYIGRSYLEEGKYEQAVTSFRQVWARWPDLPQAQEAQLDLDQLQSKSVLVPTPTPEERLLRIRHLADSLQYDQALKEAEALLENEAGGPFRKALLQQIGSLQYRLRRFEAARRSFETLAQEQAAQPDYPETAVWLGRIAYRLGDEARLAQLEGELASHPAMRNRPERAQLLFLLGDLYEDHQKSEEARAVYRQLLDAFPSDSLTEEAAWRLGWMAYRAGRWDRAAADFERFVSAYPESPLAIQVWYWKAKGLEKLEETDQAVFAYRQTCRITHHSYYCYRAEERLKSLETLSRQPSGIGDEPFSSNPVPLSESVETIIPPLVEAPLLPEDNRPFPEVDTRFPNSDADAIDSPVLLPEGSPIQELFRMGLETEAVNELDRLIQKSSRGMTPPGNRGSPSGNRMEGFLALNRILADHGQYAQAFRNLRLYAPEFRDRMGDDFPSDFWWIAYPQGMREEVGLITKDIQVDADLVTAVIREESSYDPEAVSSVGALGLMQLMPGTAQWMAKRINLDSFSREKLYLPSVNIKLGSHYLAFLLDRFEGDPILAVAAYNAGPDMVARWKELNSTSDQDEFLEAIPYQETRSFVKRVMRSYYEYQELEKIRRQGPHGIDRDLYGIDRGSYGIINGGAFLDNK
jgi:peptidoglycan lytic transglycosylase